MSTTSGTASSATPLISPGSARLISPRSYLKNSLKPPMDADHITEDRVSRKFHLRLSAFICG
jgi:hypothetical protein